MKRASLTLRDDASTVRKMRSIAPIIVVHQVYGGDGGEAFIGRGFAVALLFIFYRVFFLSVLLGFVINPPLPRWNRLVSLRGHRTNWASKAVL